MSATTNVTDAAAAQLQTPPLAHRLQATSQRIAQLLDHMGWKEEHTTTAAIAAAPAGQQAHTATAAAEQSDPNANAAVALPAQAASSSGASSGAAASSSASAAASASSSSPSPSALSPLFLRCRPLDRTAFLARVATFSPLLGWLHRPQCGAALSPLFLARHGWINAGIEGGAGAGAAQAETVWCALCHARVTLHIAPEVLALPSSTAAQQLARRYATEVIPHAHTPQCAWTLAQADVDFTRIVPGGVRTTAAAAGSSSASSGSTVKRLTYAQAIEQGVSASQRAVVMGQAEQRASNLRQQLSASAAGLWNRFTVHTTFLAAVEEQLRFTHSSQSLLSARGGLGLPLLLALCGWEIRPTAAAVDTTIATASPAIASTSTSLAASSPSSVVLQCCFGCREVGALDRFCDALPSSAVAADADDGNHATMEGSAAHESKEVEEEEEEEERSMFQSPLKRRKLRADDSTGLATATAASTSSAVAAALSAAAAASSTPVAPAEPQSHPVVRASAHGFHASLEHRPFCPFLLPLVDEADLAPSTTAADSSALSARDERKPATNTTDADDLPLGWQQVLRWWLQREREKRLVAAQLDEQAAAAAGLSSGEPIDAAVAASSSSSAGAASSSASSSSSSSSSLLHKEAHCRQAIGTVRKLLSNIAQLPTIAARSTVSSSGSRSS